MPVAFHCSNSPVTQPEAERLWEYTCAERGIADEQVNIACVSPDEIQRLNNQYRGKNKPTNVLTFSYGEGEHDVVLCLETARAEAEKRHVTLRDYTALLLVHAFLHAAGLDHEQSEGASAQYKRLETVILQQAGFPSEPL